MYFYYYVLLLTPIATIKDTSKGVHFYCRSLLTKLLYNLDTEVNTF